MLAEKKKKMRLPLDPNNKNWTEDTSSFGRKMMEKMGWKTGQGLGLNNDGTTSHIKISVKEDNLGIGASIKDSESGWLNNSKTYQEVLDRLAASISSESNNETKTETIVNKKRKIIAEVDDNFESKEQKKKSFNKSKSQSHTDKDKNIIKKENKKTKNKDKTEKSKSKSKDKRKTKIQTNPTVLKQAHRAKFIRNKAVSTYSEANLKEILGEINS